MIISTTTDAYAQKFGEHDAIKYLAQAGFDAFDYSLFYMHDENKKHPLLRDDYKEYAQSLRRTADEHNIACNQSHAPFPSYIANPNAEQSKHNEIIVPIIVRAMEAAAILGAKIIVVHPITLDDPVEQKDFNLNFYNNLLPYCKKFNIKVALENMWGWDDKNKKVTPGACASGVQFCEYIDALDSDWFTACIDLGHAEMQGSGGGSAPELIHALGDRLEALHIHDNNKINDTHALPFMGKMDWEPIMLALRDINYSGDFTFECDDAFLHKLPAELYLNASAFMFDIAQYFIGKYGLS